MNDVVDDLKASEEAKAISWKLRTAALPERARVPARWVGHDGREHGGAREVRLPAGAAEFNLLPDVREPAIALFRELGIPWHCGVSNGPGNHLLSSQVQCVNALGRMVADPSRIIRAFGSLLDTADVLEIEPGRHLTFEFIGDDDLLGEAVHGVRTRGAPCTSVDAAFLHRTTSGSTELVLVEWKYTETYSPHEPEPAKNAERRRRYEHLLMAPDSPVDGSALPFDHFLDEPLYQLMRQQLLAYELEKRHAVGADVVRVVHVQPLHHAAY